MYTVHGDFFISQKYYWWLGWTLRNLAKVLGQSYGGCSSCHLVYSNTQDMQW